MTTFYADTSILLKRHVDEPGAGWFRNLIKQEDDITTSELSLVEVYSAFNRLVREGEGRVTADLYVDLTALLNYLFEARYVLTPVSPAIMNSACAVLERHPLRAYDAMHLASALFANEELVSSGIAGLTFLSSDHRLLAAAAAEGMSTFDPATTA